MTEKYWIRALTNKLVPIVMNGANMTTFAPEHSYLDVMDFDSPRVQSIMIIDHLTFDKKTQCLLITSLLIFSKELAPFRKQNNYMYVL